MSSPIHVAPASAAGMSDVDPNANLPIAQLPAELILQISEHLPLYDVVRWGLTCRRFYGFGGVDPNTWTRTHCKRLDHDTRGRVYEPLADAEERWRFLLEMEPTLPDHELCRYCKIFHPRTSTPWKPPRISPAQESIGTECDAQEVHLRGFSANGKSIEWGFGFRDLVAVMNRHLFKDARRLPSSELNVSTDWTYMQSFKNIHNVSRAAYKRFVGFMKLDCETKFDDKNQLLVHRTQRLWIPIHLQGSDIILRYGMGDIAAYFQICAHHTACSGEMTANFVTPFRKSLEVVLDAIFRGDQSTCIPHIVMPCQHCGARRLVRKCQDCPTEYEVTYYSHGDRSVEVVLDVWQNLGHCRDPHAPGWQTCWGLLNPRFQALCPGGFDTDVSRQWHASDVKYALEKDLFDRGPSQSAADHVSAALVHKTWQELEQGPEHQHDNGPTCHLKSPIQPNLTKHQRDKIRQDVAYARHDNTGRRDTPFDTTNLPHRAYLDQGAHVSFTRSGQPEYLNAVSCLMKLKREALEKSERDALEKKKKDQEALDLAGDAASA